MTTRQSQLPLGSNSAPPREYEPFVPGPNPKLPEFIARHSTPYDPEKDTYDVPAFDRDLVVDKAAPPKAIYDMHTYWSKKHWAAIREYIRHYLPEKYYPRGTGLVLDCFSGSGMTGVAAMMEDRPCVLIDASPAAAFISHCYTHPVDPDELQAAYDRMMTEEYPADLKAKLKDITGREIHNLTEELDWLYETRCDLYHVAGVAGLTTEQILDAVCDLKPNEDELEAQLGHYAIILEEMRSKLRSQIRVRDGRYEFVPKESGQYDDVVYQATERLKNDRNKFWEYFDRLMALTGEPVSPFAGFVPEEDGRLLQFKVVWHGQERSGRVTAADLLRPNVRFSEVDTHGNEDDFVVVFARRPMTDKQLEQVLQNGGTADPRLCVWAPAEPSPEERATLAAVLAHLLVADEHKQSVLEREGRRQFAHEAPRAFTEAQAIYARGVARTSRTSLDISLVGGVRGALEMMARKAMDTCYRSRSIDFGNRKFDSQGAVKLVNGLVRRGQAVSEGDQLWSAVENFAGPLGLVRADHPRRLDPSGSVFYQEIRKRVEERGGAGLEIRTVYNWFTGYDPRDGKESPGLTRRMVDIYLLCLVQQGHIRISDRRGGWIDRATIGEIEFKPEHFRNFHRIELTKAYPRWEVFYRYLEVLVGRPEGSLGPKFDRAAADEALRALWDSYWIRDADIKIAENALRDLFGTLGREKENPFDDLLLYWLEFADEKRPEPFDSKETYDALCRAVLKASDVGDVDALTTAHLAQFKENFERLATLRASFDKTRETLLRAARLARAQLPETAEMKDIERAQKEVLAELDKVAELVVSPDTVNTRLIPRLQRLGDAYVPAYLDALMTLASLQEELRQACAAAEGSDELGVLSECSDFAEARAQLESVRRLLGTVPGPLRRAPEERDVAEREVRAEACVKDLGQQPLTLRRLARECEDRRQAIQRVSAAPRAALRGFAGFLRSPRVADRLRGLKDAPRALTEILQAATEDDLADVLLTLPRQELKSVAKLLTAVIGEKRPKAVRLSAFAPKSGFIWEADDIDTVVGEFCDYLKSFWEDGCYLKIEKE